MRLTEAFRGTETARLVTPKLAADMSRLAGTVAASTKLVGTVPVTTKLAGTVPASTKLAGTVPASTKLAADYARLAGPFPITKLAADYARLAGPFPITKLAADYARLIGTVPITMELAADFARLVDAILETSNLATSMENVEPGYAGRQMIARREVAVYLTILMFLIVYTSLSFVIRHDPELAAVFREDGPTPFEAAMAVGALTFWVVMSWRRS